MSSYLHLAKTDLKYTQFGIHSCNDEIELNYAAYHLHQAIEKIIKALLELDGVDLTDRLYRTHDIGFLISKLEDQASVPGEIQQNVYKINRWHSEPRYNINFRQSRDELDLVYNATFHWLEDIVSKFRIQD